MTAPQKIETRKAEEDQAADVDVAVFVRDVLVVEPVVIRVTVAVMEPVELRAYVEILASSGRHARTPPSGTDR